MSSWDVCMMNDFAQSLKRKKKLCIYVYIHYYIYIYITLLIPFFSPFLTILHDKLLLHDMANPGKHELFNPPINLPKADRRPDELLNILFIFRRECCGMFGLKLAKALSHMTDPILAFSDLLNQTLILLLWEHHGDFHIS